MSIVEQLIPVGTLVLGAGLTSAGSRRSERKTARSEARDLLAESTRLMWDRESQNAYIDLQVYLAKLRGKLLASGVPARDVQAFTRWANAFWQSVTDAGDPEVGWYQANGHASDMVDLTVAVLDARLSDRWRSRSARGALRMLHEYEESAKDH